MRFARTTDAVAAYAAILDTLPIVSYLLQPDGSIAFVSRAWTRFSGHRPEDVLDGGYASIVHPDDFARLGAGAARVRERGGSYRDEFRLRFADGTYRWVLTQAEPLHRVDDAAVVGWIGTVTDIDDGKRYAAGLREQSEFTQRLLASSEDCIKVLDLEARLVSISPNGRRLLAIADAHDVIGTDWTTWWDGADRAAAERAVTDARGGETGRFGASTTIAGERRYFDIVATPIVGEDRQVERILVVSRDVSERRLAEQRRALSDEGLALLVRTGAAFVRTLDYRATLDNVARACVGPFASLCVIDVRDEAGGWERTVAHRIAELEPLLQRLSPPSGAHPVVRSISLGRSAVADVDDAWLRGIAADDERVALVRRLGLRSIVTVPVVMPDGDIAGALTLGVDRHVTREDFRDDELPFVEEVGRRAGAAIANARSYERERRIAVELQAASLPATLANVDHLRLDAEYRPGSDEATIGGDWYDAFALEDGRVAITVGDVLGHGLRAAVTMTKLRQAMQTTAMVRPDPATMLEVADRTIRLLDHETYATALAAIYDRTTHTIVVASAGHPGPATRDPDGRIEMHDCPGIMLGLGGPGKYTVQTVAARPSSTLAFFTDGLIEATRNIDQGYEMLRAALADDTLVGCDRPALAIVDRTLHGRHPGDDVALLVARVAPDSEPAADPEQQTTYDERVLSP